MTGASVAIIVVLVLSASASTAGRPGRPPTAQHWVTAWEGPPTDASAYAPLSTGTALTGESTLTVDDQTIRAVLTPTYGGTVARVGLTNTFGTSPVMLAHVTVALAGTNGSLASRPVQVTFDGRPSTTLPSGGTTLSDPVHMAFAAWQDLAVSMYVANDVGTPDEHYVALQPSYLTDIGKGDHTDDGGASFFDNQTTARPLVDDLDVLAPTQTRTVVALGDSVTEGYQGTLGGVPDQSWPDDLARRAAQHGVPLTVVNAGISGNRVLLDSTAGGQRPTFGPSALERIRRDVVEQPGVTTVIWLEGLNDIGLPPFASASRIEAGFVDGIRVLHRAGLRVLLGTLTPATGAGGEYGTATADHTRQEVNRWIRTGSPADGIIDFAGAVADPTDPSRLDPAFDSGDHIHLDAAGYRAMADAVPLSDLG